MFYGVLSDTGALRYCCAGHEPPLLVTRSGVRALEAGGFVLGLFGNAAYEPETVQLHRRPDSDWDAARQAGIRTDPLELGSCIGA